MAYSGADLALADLLAIHVQGRGATLAKRTSGVSKLHAYLVVARRQRAARLGVEVLDIEEVVKVFEIVVFGVEVIDNRVDDLGEDEDFSKG